MAHHMDDIYRLDLIARRLGVQCRRAVGASGITRDYWVLCGPEEALAYADEKWVWSEDLYGQEQGQDHEQPS